MRKLLSRLTVAIAAGTAAIAFPVQAAKLLDARVNVQQEKHNVVVHFANAAIGVFAAPANSDLNSFIGVTSDFGGTLPVFVVFKEGMPMEQSVQYAEHQGKNHGTAQCELVQKGNTPLAPAVKLGVLAQNCTVLSVAYD